MPHSQLYTHMRPQYHSRRGHYRSLLRRNLDTNINTKKQREEVGGEGEEELGRYKHTLRAV